MTHAPRALQRGLQACALVVGRPDGLGFAELATALGTSDSATHRLILGLVELECLSKNEQGRYVAAAGLARLQPGGNRCDLLRAVAAPFVRRLAAVTGNTALLVASTGEHMVVLDRQEHEDSIAMQPTGTIADNFRYPPWGWLFRHPDELARLPQRHDTPPAMRTIRQQLRELPERGYVVRFQDDRRRLAAPLRDHGGACVAVLAIGGTPVSLPDVRLAALGEELRRAAVSCQRLFTGG